MLANNREAMWQETRVSVPLRGIISSNYWAKEVTFDYRTFPSPYGELLVLINDPKSSPEERISFPSPYGELLVLITARRRYGSCRCLVSVPLRGIISSNLKNCSGKWPNTACFRPLTGNY